MGSGQARIQAHAHHRFCNLGYTIGSSSAPAMSKLKPEPYEQMGSKTSRC